MLRTFFAALLAFAVALPPCLGDIVINEIASSSSSRVTRWDANGVPRLGTGVSWYEGGYSDAHWQTGPAPFGFGTTTPAAPAFGTNVQTRMQYLTPTLYLRKKFNVSAGQAALTDQLQLITSYNDGIIVFINGVEVRRRWAGPPNQIHYHDQPAQDPDLNSATADTALTSETLDLGATNTLLVNGENTIAVHVLNISALSSNLVFSGQLRINNVSPVVLVNTTDTWKYFPGVVEPSGGVYDPTLLSSGRLNVPWGRAAFVDTSWSSGTGPIGQGAGGLGTTLTGVVGVTPSLYVRKVFTATEAQALSTEALQLLVDYDDAFVAYLNGVEIARANLQNPNTFVPTTAVSSATRNFGTTTTITIDPAVANLVTGTNVLAIQVHNVSIGDSDIAVRGELRRGATTLVSPSTTWKYKIGTEEPVQDVDGAVEDNPDNPDSVTDWIELHNNGTGPVSLTGWTLTDDPKDPARWTFPNISIPAGGYLVVICDGLDITAPAPGGYLHTNFKIGGGGEYLGLRDGNQTLVQQFDPAVPNGSPFHSYGRNAGGSYVFFDVATPGLPNTGNEFAGRVAKPIFSVPGGFYPGQQSVSITTTTPGATIRYTLDGSEPTATTGTLYTGPITVASPGGGINGVAVQARAFLNGWLPSERTNQTYLIGLSTPYSTLPAVSLVGDEKRSLYRPFGVMAIKENVPGAGGNYPSGPWSALGNPAQYNNANFRGRFMERPVNWQMLYPANTPGFSLDIGLRMAGSPYTRPRYVMTNQNRDVNPNQGAWSLTDTTQKVSMNFYMRNDLGGDPLDFPVIPNSPVTKHSDFRFRAGHNDVNPFIVDELMRRMHASTGQQGSLGANVTLYINGVYKGIFNICQHVREEFLKEAFNSDLSWDVLQVAVPSDGDLISFQELFTYMRTNSQATLANYLGTQSRLDVVNLADYILVNVYGATADWPHNNWIAAKERSSAGRWRFFTWDAEGAFGGFSLNVRQNCFTPGTTHALVVTPTPQSDPLAHGARVLYTLLRDSPEFKLLMADRIQKHFFNGGALSNSVIAAKNTSLANEVQGFIGGFNSTRIPNWINGTGSNSSRPEGQSAVYSASESPSRRQVLLYGYTDTPAGGVFIPGHFVTEGIWPATKAPVFSQHGGSFSPGFSLTITSPSGGTIYYTLNGSDPRAAGGAPQGLVYSSPVALTQTVTVKARVRSAGGEWSPLTEALFVSNVLPPILITEVMYHPPDFTPAGESDPIDGNEFEFIELKNTGGTPLDLFGLRFTSGVDFTFPAGSSIPANGFVVIAKNATQFAKKYPGVPVLGAYGPGTSLANSGETITLSDAAGTTLFSMTYSDDPPWPVDADGGGYSLVPMLPNSNPAPSTATNWRLSGSVNGSPGADDPAPGIPQIQITEVLANSVSPDQDAIELYNPGAEVADISGWYLSDDLGTPKKYKFPEGTTIPAGGYLVVTEAVFNTGPNAFALSQNGDEAVLSSANSGGNLTGLTEFLSFGASEPGVSIGRHTVVYPGGTVKKNFVVALKEKTLGAANTGPRKPDVIITEVHYAPTFGFAEFIEIRNNGEYPVNLFDPANPTNTWRMSGVDFYLPTGITLQPRQFLILSATSPAAFRTQYTVNAAVAVYGPFQPQDLSNTGERVALQKPGVPYVNGAGQTVVPYIDVDFVTYETTTPWPTGAATSGRSMERANLNGFGEDPTAWKASSSVAGNVGRFSPMPYSIWQTLWFSGEAALQGPMVDADFDGITNLLEYYSGTNPRIRDSQGFMTPGTMMVSGSGPYMTVTFRRSLSTQATTLTLEAGSTYGSWLTGQTQFVPPAVNNGDGSETVTYRDSVQMGDSDQRFIRVKITN